jgi:gamma-glutamyl-gamma-aminobutyrate hydrolase PuuD
VAVSPLLPRIGVFGMDEPATDGPRGCRLWDIGYESALKAAGAEAVMLGTNPPRRGFKEWLSMVDGIVWTSTVESGGQASSDDIAFCQWCRKNRVPLLAIDNGLHALNTAFGGGLHQELSLEKPEALQHRHPPEKGLRHAILVLDDTHLTKIYGEGELVVNSEHRRGISKLARGFRVAAQALDGVVEAIEGEDSQWFAMGVQWRPASASASGLDIQLFRGLLDACEERVLASKEKLAMAAA